MRPAASTFSSVFRPGLKAASTAAFCLLAVALAGRLSAQTTLNFEAESLKYTGSGATTSVQTDKNSSGGKWVELAGNSTGDHIDFTVPNVAAGTYQLKMEWKGNNNRGILQLAVDGTNLGSTLDQYASGQSYPTTTFGNVTFAAAGDHDIRLTVTGKNSKSSGEALSADKFTLVGQTISPTAAPTFSPPPGTYSSIQSVTITSATSGASIRYTTDGSTPSETAGTLYSGPVSISDTTTLSAIAFKAGLADSSITTGIYGIFVPPQQVIAPAFSPAGGTYSSTQTVTITSATSGASIRYTTDGSTPSETAGTLYSGPVSISATTTLNAIAYAAGMTDSTVTSATYTIGSGGPVVTLFDGTSFNGWTQVPANSWTLDTPNLAMSSLGSGRGFIYANNKYQFYRLRFEMRHLPVTGGNKDHKSCMVFFGTSPSLDAMGGIQFQYPNGGDWDYRPGVNKGGGPHFTSFPHPTLDSSQWFSVEVLIDGRHGTARLAEAQPVGSKATEVIDFNDPTDAVTGYFAFQMHNSGLHDEYRNVTIEVNPAVDDLITTK